MARTGQPGESYRKAYDADNMKGATISRAARVLLNKPHISTEITRLEELFRQQALSKVEITVDTQTAKLEEVIEMAKEKKQLGVIVQAVMGQARLHGMMDDKTSDADPYATMTAADIRKRRKELEKLLKEADEPTKLKAVKTA